MNKFWIGFIVALIFGVRAFAQDSEPKLLPGPAFVISAEDEAAGIDGTIKVAVSIDKSGNVTRSGAYVGPAWPCGVDLDARVSVVLRAAEKFVLDLKFSPAIKDGKPVESQAGVSLKVGASAKPATDSQPAEPKVPLVPKMVSGGVLNGRATKLGKPRYPPEARAANAAGAVTVQVLVDEEGKVLNAQAVSGHPLLHFASREAACRSELPPTRIQGSPVKLSGVLVYNFVP